MKEKLLLSVGVVFVLFGVIGVCAVGFAYYYTKPYLDELPSDIEAIFAVANDTTSDAAEAVILAAASLDSAGSFVETLPVIGSSSAARQAATSFHSTAYSVMKAGGYVKMVGGYMETVKNITLGEVSLIRFAIEMSFGWIGVLHALFIMMGASILWIRKRLQSVINRNKT